jgi:DNA repair protein RecN (Recombination protein N)
MLSLLRISDYAIIDELEIELHPGFTVMTGETGAGKSILVDAVGLALGDRAESGAVRNGAERAEISLLFELDENHPGREWLLERGLDDEDLCSLRRSITAEGRSRAFINNRPVTLKDLRDLGGLLVDIHGQHAHQSLLTTKAQRELLDANAGHGELRRAVASHFAEWQQAARELERRAEVSGERDAQLDLLRYQLGEIEALGIEAGEHETLRQESDRLRYVDELQQAIGGAVDCLYQFDSGSAYSLASQALRLIEAAAEHDPSLSELHERLATTEIEINEIGHELSRRLDELEADPSRLEEIEARLDRVRQIARRHRVEESEVHALAEGLAHQIEELDTGSTSIAELEARRDETAARYHEAASKLSASRRKAGATLATSVTEKLHELGLPAARFQLAIRTKPDGREDSTGIDQIEFEVTTNPGLTPGPIDRVASGGELSRIGLALAVVATDASSIPTLVFDEVDSGIGGAVAEVVGRRLREIAGRHQVLCVTHLPQVASQGSHHYRIVKLTDGQISRTQVRQLDGEQRVEELSRMLGGIEITAATRAHAEEMIRQAAGS